MTDEWVEIPPATALAFRVDAKDLAAEYQRLAADVRHAYGILARRQAATNALLGASLEGGGIPLRIASDTRYPEDFSKPEATLARARRKFWELILARMGLRKKMSTSRYVALEARVEKGDLGEPSEAAIDAFVVEHIALIPTMIQECVREVFDWLRPVHLTHLKTNNRPIIESRTIIDYAVEWDAGKWGISIRNATRQHLLALENVWRMLAGAPSSPHAFSDLEGAISQAPRSGIASTEFFRVRLYRNKNMHLFFLDPQILRRFNMVATGGKLRP